MIITKILNIKVNNRLVKYYNSLGYDVKGGDEITIPVHHLKKNSSIKIDVKCSNCHDIKNISYHKYNMNIERGDKYYCKKCNNIKFKNTFNDKYNVDNPLKLDWVKEKIKNTVFDKYNVYWITQEQSIKNKIHNTFIKNYGGYPMQNMKILNQTISKKINDKIIKCYDLEKYNDYKKRVINLTYKNKKILFDNWNGFDFYDGEYIRDNLTYHYMDKLYPVIDHKTSISYGFKNNLSVETISDINNLCITKNSLNRLKSKKTEFEFRNILNSNSV